LLLDGSGQIRDNKQLILLSSLTAAAIVLGAVGFSKNINALTSKTTTTKTADKKKRSPPRVPSCPWIGSALEFGANCRAFLRKYFRQLDSPIITATIAGKDYHFVDSSYAEFSPERLFRSPALHFRPMANDAMQHGFGVSSELTRKMNGPDGNSNQINSLYHTHMMKPEGLTELLTQAQHRLTDVVFADGSLYPKSNSTTTTKPLYGLVQESLFRATVGAVISKSLVTPDNKGTVTASASSLEQFHVFDQKFPLLLSKLPPWMFPAACKGRQALIEKCQGTDFEEGIVKMLQQRNQLLADQLGITTPQEQAELAMMLIWAAAANTMPAGFWLLYQLLQNKDTAYAAIVKEVDELYQMRRRGKDRQQESNYPPLTLEEIDQLDGLDSAWQETLRMYSESMIARDVMEDVELDLKIPGEDHKYMLRKNSRVAILMSCLHLDESVFANAHDFVWDRFRARTSPEAGNNNKKVPPIFTKHGKVLSTPVRPFGGGVSMCPGRKFASYEINVFLANLLHRYDLELVDQDKTTRLETDPSRAGLGMHVPLGDVNVRITNRILYN
jgi:cholesterol 7alpha-monooxygenase